MIKEVTDSAGRVVLFIDEIHTVVGAGATSGAMDAGAQPTALGYVRLTYATHYG